MSQIDACKSTSTQSINFSTHALTEKRGKFNAPQALAYGAAVLLAAASVITNVASAIARHTDLPGQIVSGSIALAVAVLVTVALAAALQSLARRQYIAAALAALTFALAAAFSVSSALGMLGGSRLQASLSHDHVESERTRLEFERRNAVNELSGIAPTRDAAEITPEIARRLAVSGVDGCATINGPISRQHCGVIASLQGELATSQKRSALVGMIAQHDRDLTALGAPMLANKDAAVLAHVLAAIGFTVKADAINTALMVLGVLILECGAGLSLVTASALAVMHDATLAATVSLPATVKDAIENVPAPAPEAPATVAAPAIARQILAVTNSRPNAAHVTAEKIKALALANGGMINETQRALAARIGSSKTSVVRALALMAASGAIVSNAGGIRISLAD